MATRVLPFTITIPPGTTKAAPFTQALALDGWAIERIDLEVPRGPAGLMGFQIYNNGVAWIPYGPGQWIVWDGVKDTYYISDQPVASGWALVGYNTGFFPHEVTLRFHVSPPDQPEQAAQPLPTFTTSAPALVETVTL